MAKEIERKFLVDLEKWDKKGIVIPMVQAYLVIEEGKVIRVRIAGEKAFLTIKGKPEGISRDEFEYEIPLDDALQMIPMCIGASIEKARYVANVNNKIWEVDVFEGENKGLVVAEVELESVDEQVNLPDWVLQEVSSERRYYNFALTQNPYSQW